MSEQFSELQSIYRTDDFHVVLVFRDPIYNYTKKVKINAPCEFYRYKSEIPHLICLNDVDYYKNVLFTEEEFAKEKAEECRSEYLQQLYYIDFKTKTVELIFETNGKILDYDSDFVFYMPKENFQCIVIRNLHTNEEYTISLEFEIKKAKVGSKYAVFYGGISFHPFCDYDLYFGGYQDPFVIYDKEQKRIIHQVMTKNTKNILNVSDDFLNGKIPFYFVEKQTNQWFNICAIYNKGKFLGEVKYYYTNILIGFKDMLVNNFLITEKTQYVSDVDNEKGLIKFYKLNEDGLEFVNTLQVSKHWHRLYVTHLFSCGAKFVICERSSYTETYRKIFLYDVNKGEIEYENDYYVNTQHFFDAIVYKLFLYAHGFQDYFYHIFKDENGEVVIMSSKEWFKLARQKKAVKEILKAFKKTEQLDNPKLKV